MKPTIYKFNEKIGLLDNKLYTVKDYTEYYTTGIEDVIREYPQIFAYSIRDDLETPENIMYNMFNDENLADVIVACNNENFIWNVPMDFDLYNDAVDFRMLYLRFLMLDRMDDIQVDSIMKERMELQVDDIDRRMKKVFIPHPEKISFTMKRIKDYIRSRKCE